jgi:fission process protein 1
MSENSDVDVPKLSADDLKALKELYDSNKDGTLSQEEIVTMIHDYNNKKIADERIVSILKKYDNNGDGVIDLHEHHKIAHSVSLQESELRYAAYTLGLSRIFRYLAFTSDFGEALRPVVHKRIVTATYGVAFAYCFADVAWEAYKTNDCHTNPQSKYREGEEGKKYMTMSVTQCVVERSTFQAFASLALPALIIHKTVHYANIGFKKLGRFTKWGPSIVGLSLIPLLPVYLDAPVEHAIEYGFHHYGPWAKKEHAD